jgi:hypothetical protein
MIWTLLQESTSGTTQDFQTSFRSLVFILVFLIVIAGFVIWWIKRST